MSQRMTEKDKQADLRSKLFAKEQALAKALAREAQLEAENKALREALEETDRRVLWGHSVECRNVDPSGGCICAYRLARARAALRTREGSEK